jgi:hypothetical protein
MSRRIVSIICKTGTSIASVKCLLGKIFSCLLFIPAKCQLFQTQEFLLPSIHVHSVEKFQQLIDSYMTPI